MRNPSGDIAAGEVWKTYKDGITNWVKICTPLGICSGQVRDHIHGIVCAPKEVEQKTSVATAHVVFEIFFQQKNYMTRLLFPSYLTLFSYNTLLSVMLLIAHL